MVGDTLNASALAEAGNLTCLTNRIFRMLQRQLEAKVMCVGDFERDGNKL